MTAGQKKGVKAVSESKMLGGWGKRVGGPIVDGAWIVLSCDL